MIASSSFADGVAQLDSSWVRSTRNSGHKSNQEMTSFPFESQLGVSCAFGTQLLRSWASRRNRMWYAATNLMQGPLKANELERGNQCSVPLGPQKH